MADLERYKKAQQYDYEKALQEIQSGRKRSHWMWYIFPQIHGLGHSSTSQYYAIHNLQEARDYLADVVLGTRLNEITNALLKLNTDDPHEVFGAPDDRKLLSCMTLFSIADPDNPIFVKVLEKYYHGRKDDKTIEILKADDRCSQMH